MSRRIIVSAVAAGVLLTGPACRLCHRDSCASHRETGSGFDACATSLPQGIGGGMSGGGLYAPVSSGAAGGDSFPFYPTSFGGPSYPVGEPVPLRSAPGPANELPYPSLPASAYPDAPAAASGAAIPPPNARTTADPKFFR